VMSFRPAQERF